MAPEFRNGFSLVRDTAGVERIVWPSSEAGIPDLAAARQRQRREAALASVRAEFLDELDDEGVPALRRCIHWNKAGRCAKQGTKRADGKYRCALHAKESA